MPIFIKTKNGYINVDHIARYTCEPEGAGPYHVFRFFNSEAAELGSARELEHAFDSLSCAPQFIATLPGYFVLIRTEGTDEFSRVPVVGWKASGFALAPVAANGYSGDAPIEWPNGEVFADGGWFESLAVYVSYLQEDDVSANQETPDMLH